MRRIAGLLALALATLPGAAAQARKFSFSAGASEGGRVAVAAGDIYSAARGFGFEPGQPTYFSVAVPEGNYKVTVKLGDAHAAYDNTVYAELRRLMVEQARRRYFERPSLEGLNDFVAGFGSAGRNRGRRGKALEPTRRPRLRATPLRRSVDATDRKKR